MSATRAVHATRAASPVLYDVFELSWGTCKLAFSVGPGRPPSFRSIPARCTNLVMFEISKAKSPFGLPEKTKVISCYEAGRDASEFTDPSSTRGFRTSERPVRCLRRCAATLPVAHQTEESICPLNIPAAFV